MASVGATSELDRAVAYSLKSAETGWSRRLPLGRSTNTDVFVWLPTGFGKSALRGPAICARL